MNLKNQIEDLDRMVAQGAIVDAVKKYFAEDAHTSDYGNVSTANKEQMVEKMEGFTASIAKVNNIQHHYTIVDGDVSASEFTFNFDMKDGNKILWHEIIRRVWNKEGKIVQEEYFQA